MNRLDSSGVVIERDDLAPGFRNRCLDALFQIEILDRCRQRLSQRLSDPRFDHFAICFAKKSRFRGEAWLRGCTLWDPMLIAGWPSLPRFTKLSRVRQAI